MSEEWHEDKQIYWDSNTCIACGTPFDSSKWNRRKWEESDEDGCDCHCVECARYNIKAGFWTDPREARMKAQKQMNKIFGRFYK